MTGCATEQTRPHKGAVMPAGANSFIIRGVRIPNSSFLNKYKIKLVKKKKAKYRIEFEIFFLTGLNFPRVLVQKCTLLRMLVSRDVLFTTPGINNLSSH